MIRDTGVRIDFSSMCYSLVQGLTRKQFQEILGSKGLQLEKYVIDLYKELND